MKDLFQPANIQDEILGMCYVAQMASFFTIVFFYRDELVIKVKMQRHQPVSK